MALGHSINMGLICSRSLGDLTLVDGAFRSIFSRVGQLLHSTPHSFTILAEDAHGREISVLRDITATWPNGKQPLPEIVIYMHDGPDPGSATAGETAFHDSGWNVKKISVPDDPDDDLVYPVDEAIIRDCDILVLASQGRPEEDERTVDILRFARLIGRSLFHINARNGSIIEMRNNDRYLETLEHLNTYNKERLDDTTFEKAVDRYANIITKKVIRSGIPPEVVRPLCNTIMPQFTRAHLLSSKYRRLYKSAGNAVYGLSALAVLTITLQTLFFPTWLWLIWLEVIEIAVILMFIIGSRLGEWHRKWIDYRFLAERTRAAFFLCIICIHCDKPVPASYMSLEHHPNDWMIIAFKRIVEMKPMEYCRLDIPFVPLKTFILDAWVDNRLSYFSKASEKNSGLYNLYANIGEAIFFITLILAVAHATGHAFEEAVGLASLPLILAAFTIILPAIGAALSAIRVQREYLRNSERYAHIMRHLSTVRNQIHEAGDLKTLCELLEEMNEVTVREQQDWRIIFRFRDIEA